MCSADSVRERCTGMQNIMNPRSDKQVLPDGEAGGIRAAQILDSLHRAMMNAPEVQ